MDGYGVSIGLWSLDYIFTKSEKLQKSNIFSDPTLALPP
jgi:hypothetical protein